MFEPPLARAILALQKLGMRYLPPCFSLSQECLHTFSLSRDATDYVPRPDAVPLPDGFDQFNNEVP